jgi:hypothetical protein
MWYSAMIISEVSSRHNEGIETTYETAIILIEAENEIDAEKKAQVLGRQREDSYLNCDGETVFWRFIRIDEIQKINAEHLATGTELFYRLYFPKGDGELPDFAPPEFYQGGDD